MAIFEYLFLLADINVHHQTKSDKRSSRNNLLERLYQEQIDMEAYSTPLLRTQPGGRTAIHNHSLTGHEG